VKKAAASIGGKIEAYYWVLTKTVSYRAPGK
jgi:hypothetical protein